MYKCLISELIDLCNNYLSTEDMALLNSFYLEPPINILKDKNGIQYNQLNCTSYANLLNQNLCMFLHKIETLDFIISIDLFNRFENVKHIIEKVGALITSGGIFAFTYERINKEDFNDSSRPKSSALKSFPIKGGVIQKLLVTSGFYIQHEIDYPTYRKEDNFIVLIIAQKK